MRIAPWIIGASSLSCAVSISAAFQTSHSHSLKPSHQIMKATMRSLPLYSSFTSTIDVRETAPRDVISVRQWASNAGIHTSDGFQILETKDEDGLDNAHAITTQDLPRDSPILFVPSDVILTGHKSRLELGNAAFDAEQMLSGFYGEGQISKFYLFLKLLREFQLGQASPFFSYFDSLPRFFSNGSSMTDFCYGCLPPYAAGLALADKTRMKLFVEALDGVSFFDKDITTNKELTKWAFAVVNTRSMELPNGDFGIIPIADFFNHGGVYEANAYISFDDDGNCYTYSAQDIPEGFPLLVSYGDSTNPSKLLAEYGFLDESSAATYCKYIIDGPDEAVKAMGYPDQMLFFSNGDISPQVWDCVLYEQLDKTNSPKKHQLYDAVMSGDEATRQQLHQEDFFLALRALQKHVDFLVNELDELEIGIETQLRNGRNADRHPRLPLLMRHNQYIKTILERVQENLDNMG